MQLQSPYSSNCCPLLAQTPSWRHKYGANNAICAKGLLQEQLNAQTFSLVAIVLLAAICPEV